jgi:BlaI family penicillinase repressor
MAKQKNVRLGELQLLIMQVLWERSEELTVSEVQEALTGRDLAYTTVATMLRKMEARGLVGHQADGRRFLYFAKITPSDVSGGVARDLVDRIFAGNLANAVNHLLRSRDVDTAELNELEKLIQQHKRDAKRGHR